MSVSRSEKTWKPPESVRIGPSQAEKACSPPSSAITSSPGRKWRWYVFPRTICDPMARSSSGSRLFTVPFVPTGMKAGVRTSPCTVRRMPARAAPSVAVTSKWLTRSSLGTSAGPADRPAGVGDLGREVASRDDVAARRAAVLEHEPRTTRVAPNDRRHLHRPPVAPLGQGEQDRAELLPCGREPVLVPRRPLLVQPPLDDARPL